MPLLTGSRAGQSGTTVMYLDVTSVACEGDACHALQRVVFSELQETGGTPPFDEVVTLQVLHCEARTMGTATFAAFRDGERVHEVPPRRAKARWWRRRRARGHRGRKAPPPVPHPVWFEQHRAKSRCARREPTHSARVSTTFSTALELRST